MLQHTLLLTFRNFMRHKSSFFINLIGLSTGLACAILIFLWIQDEMGVDKFHAKDHRLFEVMEHQQYADEIMTTYSTPGLLAETLAEEVPEIEYSATIMWSNRPTLSVGEKNIKYWGRPVGEDFFHMFSFPLLAGQKDQVLKEFNAMVISQSVAEGLFGSVEEAMGQTLEVDHEESYIVTGVFEDVPPNSTLTFDFLTPYKKYLKENEWLREWGNNSPRTVVTLIEGADPEKVTANIADFVKVRNEESNVELFLAQLSGLYLYGRYENGQQAGGRIEYIRLFSIIALFIIVIACINFMNLSTARATKRAKEVGIKKSVGVQKHLIIKQFLGESLLLTLLSLVVALILVTIILPQFNLITEKQMKFEPSPLILGVLLLLTLFTGLLAGSYPAFYLSSFKPVSVLKGRMKGTWGELLARKGLVVFQFTLSFILILSVIVIYRQIQYVQSENLGYEKDQLIYFSKEGNVDDQTDAFLQRVNEIPGVQTASTIGHDLIGRQNNTSGLEWEGKDPNDRILFENVRVNYDLLETIGVEFVEGRSFSREYGADSSKIIFNETAIEIMGLEDPIGKKIRLWDEFDMEIIGVVKDFHFQSLHEDINPLFFRLDPEMTWFVMAKLEAGKEQQALADIQDFYKDFNPGFSFDYEFMDEEYAQQYEAERLVGYLSRYFAGFAILISCLGLLGLATFTGEIRKKEIGIRKVLGATTSQIVLILTKDFTRLVLIAIGLGLPISYLLINNWLGQFAYKIDLSVGFFVLSGLSILIISWLTVSSQAYKSSQINPTESLRSE